MDTSDRDAVIDGLDVESLEVILAAVKGITEDEVRAVYSNRTQLLNAVRNLVK